MIIKKGQFYKKDIILSRIYLNKFCNRNVTSFVPKYGFYREGEKGTKLFLETIKENKQVIIPDKYIRLFRTEGWVVFEPTIPLQMPSF